MDELASHSPRLAELVDLKYFCGFSFTEIGKLQGISERTVSRDWQKVRLLLYRHLSEHATHGKGRSAVESADQSGDD